MATKELGAGPSGSTDTTTKLYVDTLVGYRRAVATQQNTTANTAQDVTALTVTSMPAGTYIVYAYIIYRVATVTTTIQLGVTGGTLSTMSLYRKRQITTTTFASGTLLTAYGVSAVAGSTAATTDFEATLSGRLVTSGAGDFKVQFASGTSAIQASIMPGSWLTVIPST